MPYANPSDISLAGGIAGISNLSGFFNGRLAPIAVYQYALTATQVSNHYTAGSTSGSTYESTIEGDSPYAYWPLKETSGTTATDIVGGHNGTYTGGVTLGSAAGIPGDSGTTAALFRAFNFFIRSI